MIRKYQGYFGTGTAQPVLERRWWTLVKYFSKRKAANLKRLLLDAEYRKLFDIQLEIPALGSGMRLGMIHHMYTLKCHPVSATDPLCHSALTDRSGTYTISNVSPICGQRKYAVGTGRLCAQCPDQT